jgi:hypothetical protein
MVRIGDWGTYDVVRGFIVLTLEVQIMLKWVVLTALANSRAVDSDVEFSPSLLLDLEGRFREGYSTRLLAWF